MFFNNKFLKVNMKNYFSIILFKVNVKKYLKYNLIFNFFLDLISCVILFVMSLFMSFPLKCSLLLILLFLSSRIVGEYINMYFYERKKYIWYCNSKLYLLFVLFFSLLLFLPFIEMCFSNLFIFILSVIFIFLSVIHLVKIFHSFDYELIFKRLNSVNKVMASNFDDYLKNDFVNSKYDSAKINSNKKGYSFFNELFFLRNKGILLRGPRIISFILICVYSLLLFLVVNYNTYYDIVNNFYVYHFGYFIIIMFFVNSGLNTTRTFFYNCDYTMLSYSFYREKSIIINMFMKRFIILLVINLLPAFIICIGNTILSLLFNIELMNIFINILLIIFLDIFFSFYYLLMYYLIQPFNYNTNIKKHSYVIINALFYIITYKISSLFFSNFMIMLFIVFIFIFIILGFILLNKYALKTFRLN